MIKIKELIENIEEEIHGAKEYAEYANKYKDDDKELAEMYYSLATVELDHVDKLHKAVVRLIEKYRATKGEPPTEMKAIWVWEHEKQIEEVAEIKILLEMSRK